MEASAVPAPVLSPEERSLYEKGVGEFNARLFFECHDTLEELWAGVRGPSRALTSTPPTPVARGQG